MLRSKSQSLSGTPDSRSRSPYVIKACEECRRRKIRCNGVRPCRRCDRLSLVCFYRAKRQHNSHPEQSLDLHNILNELNNLRADYEALVNSSGQGSNGSGSPQLAHRPDGSNPYRDPVFLEDMRPSDPLAELCSDEVHRLIHIYDKRAQFIYPLADLDAIRSSAAALDQHGNSTYPEEVLEEADAACLKLLLAIAMVIDDQCYGGLPAKLYESSEAHVLSLSVADGLDVKALRVFVLVAQYYFVHDRTTAAWRNIGLAVRTAVELGLNLRRKVGELFPHPRQRRSIHGLVWSIYILDFCWSLHMGFGPAVGEVDRKTGLEEPDDSMPFLRAMVDCTQIIRRAWNVISPSVNQIERLSLRAAQERLEDVYREIREWQSSSAVSSYFSNHPHEYPLNEWQRRCLKTFLYLRANELCIFLCKPILVTRDSLVENRNTLEFAMTLAKDSISVLSELNRNFSCVRVLPFVFNQFVSSALATLLLACIQEPHRYITRGGDCRPPIQTAREIIEEQERGSFIDRKLYQRSREIFALSAQCRIMGRDPEKIYGDTPEPTTEHEFFNALKAIEPLFGRVGHSV